MTSFNFVVYIIFAVLILWKAAISMIEKRKILLYSPFLLISIFFMVQASFNFYDITLQILFGLNNWMVVISIVTLFLYISRCFKND